jgi:hypothetical protein
MDAGGTELISEGTVVVRGPVKPVSYTETGLRLSDGRYKTIVPMNTFDVVTLQE